MRLSSLIPRHRLLLVSGGALLLACSGALLPAGSGSLLFAASLGAQEAGPHPSFELLTHRMDVDVDGAPNAYGPPGKPALDYARNAHYRGRPAAEIVGYLTDDDNPNVPIQQGPHDPFPGYYISQTSMTDPARSDPRDPLRYVDATKINYMVRGDAARRHGVRIGDFVAVYSRLHRRSVFGVVADDGNPSGDEGSLHLLQALGYPFHDGKDDAVEERDVVVRFYPRSNPRGLFFRSQAALDAAAVQMGLSRDFTQSRLAQGKHRKHRQ